MTRTTNNNSLGGLTKHINSKIGRAVYEYDMISDKDRILVALSGGKDSMTLLWMLEHRLSYIPVKYRLFPVYIDPGFENGFAEELKDFCKKAGFNLTVYYSDCGVVAHSSINRENPCFLCSRMRRRLLFEAAEKLRCNKLALGHNKDDIIETLFINMCYAGEISTIVPAQSFFKGKFTMIRPLSFVGEDIISRFAKENGFPVFINPCPTSKTSKRHEIKEFLLPLYKSGRKVKESIFTSMSRVRPDRMLKQR